MGKYKIVKSKEFIKQEDMLPEDVKEELVGVMKDLAKDPHNIKNSMNVFGEPSPKELKNWSSDVSVEDIDAILEYLSDKDCLNEVGKDLAHEFWKEFIRETK